jgi:hypothetical protein
MFTKKSARSRAEVGIVALSEALENYKADMGDYPRLTNGSSTGTAPPGTKNPKNLKGALTPANGKVYFEFTKFMGSISTLSSDTN